MGYKTTLCDVSLDGGHYGIAAPAVDFKPGLPAYLRITDINDDGTLNPSDRKSVDDSSAGNYLLHEGDIVFARTGNSTGRNYYYDPRDGEYAYAGFLIKFSLDPRKINPRYMKYYAQSKQYWDWVSSFNTGSTRGNINAKTYASMPIDLPSRQIQDGIVAICNAIDDKIRINRQLNDYLLELATSLFDERIKDSFEYTTVREYVKYMSNGSTPSRKNSSYWDDGTIPWIKTGEVNNKLIFDTSEHITKHALEKTSVHLLPKDTVIMALYGSGTAGRLALLQSPATTNQACTAMICESSSEAFYLFVVLKKMYHEIDNLTRGSVQQNLSKEIVANLRVPNVKKDILDSLGFNVIYSQIAFSEAETLNFTKLRDALLPRLMSGEIDVSKVDLTQLTNNHLADC